MLLSNEALKELCNQGIDAAIKAGSLIEFYANKSIIVNYKDNNGGTSDASKVVTEVDIKSQNTILKTLEKGIEKFDLALLTEESVDDKSRFEKEYFWCIDPLDGTLPFTEGVEGYSVCIALVNKGGEPVIGIVYDPKNDTLYHAIKGCGAFVNHKPLSFQHYSTEAFYLITDRSFVKHRHYKEVELHIKYEALKNGAQEFKVIKDMGAAMNAINVIIKRNACYFKFPKDEQGGGSIWDFAATACILNELKMEVSDFNGAPLPLNKSNTTFMNDCGVIFSPNKEITGWIHSAHKKVQSMNW